MHEQTKKAIYRNDGLLGPAVSKKVQYLQHEHSFYAVQFNFKLQFLTIFNERPKAAASRQDHKMQFENLVTTRIIGVVLFGLGMSRTKLDR